MTEQVSRLTIDVQPGDCLLLGDDIRVEFQQKSGRLARMVVVAPRSSRIKREPAGQQRSGEKNTEPLRGDRISSW